MDDLISRQAVIDFINDIEHRALRMSNDNSEDVLYKTVLATARAILGYCKIAPSARPEPHYDEWCETCSEYDTERHSCPRFNRVIRQTVNDLKEEYGKDGEHDD